MIEGVRGCHVFPDAAAVGQGEDPQWLTVLFEGRELWGDSAKPSLKVSIEGWSPIGAGMSSDAAAQRATEPVDHPA